MRREKKSSGWERKINFFFICVENSWKWTLAGQVGMYEVCYFEFIAHRHCFFLLRGVETQRDSFLMTLSAITVRSPEEDWVRESRLHLRVFQLTNTRKLRSSAWQLSRFGRFKSKTRSLYLHTATHMLIALSLSLSLQHESLLPHFVLCT
jgi:hypothetical protein